MNILAPTMMAPTVKKGEMRSRRCSGVRAEDLLRVGSSLCGLSTVSQEVDSGNGMELASFLLL